jgi:threonine dehydrogenase-like Zn-dependent dehydrogenase
MKAPCWHGEGDVRVETVPDPTIQNGRDAILKVTSTAICGSDLHLFDGYMPTMQPGDVLGHEFMGEVVEVGAGNDKLKKGDRVVVPFTIACGECFFCQKGLYSLCDNSNPNAETARQAIGHSPSALFGYSYMLGGIPGEQAEYVRVPYADFGAMKVPDTLGDEQVLFLTDIYPTGYMAADNCGLIGHETVAVWGCGPVGQFAINSAWALGAGRLIAIDNVPERLQLAEREGRAETINFENEDVYGSLMDKTGGRGPDCCIEAVGAEAQPHGHAANASPSNNASNHGYALREVIY